MANLDIDALFKNLNKSRVATVSEAPAIPENEFVLANAPLYPPFLLRQCSSYPLESPHPPPLLAPTTITH